MNAHPSFTVQPQAPTPADPFADEAIYELEIDTNGDAVADIAYRNLPSVALSSSRQPHRS
jgi:hypothetical protein